MLKQEKRFLSIMHKVLTEVYRELYSAMINKDCDALDQLLHKSFTIVHVNGVKQNKAEFIQAIKDGVLNYYSEDLQDTEMFDCRKDISCPHLVFKSVVSADLFGSGKRDWQMQLDTRMLLVDDEDWLYTEAVASIW